MSRASFDHQRQLGFSQYQHQHQHLHQQQQASLARHSSSPPPPHQAALSNSASTTASSPPSMSSHAFAFASVNSSNTSTPLSSQLHSNALHPAASTPSPTSFSEEYHPLQDDYRSAPIDMSSMSNPATGSNALTAKGYSALSHVQSPTAANNSSSAASASFYHANANAVNVNVNVNVNHSHTHSPATSQPQTPTQMAALLSGSGIGLVNHSPKTPIHNGRGSIVQPAHSPIASGARTSGVQFQLHMQNPNGNPGNTTAFPPKQSNVYASINQAAHHSSVGALSNAQQMQRHSVNFPINHPNNHHSLLQQQQSQRSSVTIAKALNMSPTLSNHPHPQMQMQNHITNSGSNTAVLEQQQQNPAEYSSPKSAPFASYGSMSPVSNSAYPSSLSLSPISNSLSGRNKDQIQQQQQAQLQAQAAAQAAQNSAAVGPGGSPVDGPKDKDEDALYKTELCRSFTDTNFCRYGNKCRFAHGVADLRPVARHKKYKTERCKNFARDGVCPYGPRCRFIHNPATNDADEILSVSAQSEKPSHSPHLAHHRQSVGSNSQRYPPNTLSNSNDFDDVSAHGTVTLNVGDKTYSPQLHFASANKQGQMSPFHNDDGTAVSPVPPLALSESAYRPGPQHVVPQPMTRSVSSLSSASQPHSQNISPHHSPHHQPMAPSSATQPIGRSRAFSTPTAPLVGSTVQSYSSTRMVPVGPSQSLPVYAQTQSPAGFSVNGRTSSSLSLGVHSDLLASRTIYHSQLRSPQHPSNLLSETIHEHEPPGPGLGANALPSYSPHHMAVSASPKAAAAAASASLFPSPNNGEDGGVHHSHYHQPQHQPQARHSLHHHHSHGHQHPTQSRMSDSEYHRPNSSSAMYGPFATLNNEKLNSQHGVAIVSNMTSASVSFSRASLTSLSQSPRAASAAAAGAASGPSMSALSAAAHRSPKSPFMQANSPAPILGFTPTPSAASPTPIGETRYSPMIASSTSLSSAGKSRSSSVSANSISMSMSAMLPRLQQPVLPTPSAGDDEDDDHQLPSHPYSDAPSSSASSSSSTSLFSVSPHLPTNANSSRQSLQPKLLPASGSVSLTGGLHKVSDDPDEDPLDLAAPPSSEMFRTSDDVIAEDLTLLQLS